MASENVAPTCLVTGATGAVGPSVVKALLAEGMSVRVLALDPAAPGLFPPQVRVVVGDVTDPDKVREAMDGADSVVHMAALLHIIDPPPSMREKYERVNVGGTETVYREAGRSGVKRVVLFSTISVYGDTGGSLVDEETEPKPATFYARTKLQAEEIVMSASGPDGAPVGCALRLAAVYGPRIKGNYFRLLRSLERGRFIPVGKGSNRRTLVYEDDVGRAAALALKHPSAAGKVFNVTDGAVHTVEEILGAMCSAIGRKPPAIRIPAPFARLAAGSAEAAFKLVGLRPPVGRSSVDKFLEDVAVDGGKILRELGFKPDFSLDAGWDETVKCLRARAPVA